MHFAFHDSVIQAICYYHLVVGSKNSMFDLICEMN